MRIVIRVEGLPDHNRLNKQSGLRAWLGYVFIVIGIVEVALGLGMWL